MGVLCGEGGNFVFQKHEDGGVFESLGAGADHEPVGARKRGDGLIAECRRSGAAK